MAFNKFNITSSLKSLNRVHVMRTYLNIIKSTKYFKYKRGRPFSLYETIKGSKTDHRVLSIQVMSKKIFAIY